MQKGMAIKMKELEEEAKRYSEALPKLFRMEPANKTKLCSLSSSLVEARKSR